MVFIYCKECQGIDEKIPDVLDNKVLFGPASDDDLSIPGHKEAEGINQLLAGDEIYHYFDSETTKAVIVGERIVKSKARAACKECLINSITSKYPHYGDGAYATTNGALVAEEDKNPKTIIHAHGKYYWSMQRYRAVVRIIESKSFIKYFRTGGVTRSILDGTVAVQRDALVGHSLIEGEVIRIEKWNGVIWVIDEGCCF